MINNEKMVKQMADNYKKRILENCNFCDALAVRKSLILRNEGFHVKIKEYETRRNLLIDKEKALGSEIATLISDCKNPETLSKKRREIKFEIEDCNTWIDESENMLITTQKNKELADKRVFEIISAAAGQDKVLVLDELNDDLKKIEDKAEAWSSACRQLSCEYEIAGVESFLVLENREIKQRLR